MSAAERRIAAWLEGFFAAASRRGNTCQYRLCSPEFGAWCSGFTRGSASRVGGA